MTVMTMVVMTVPACLSVCLYVCLSVCLSVCLLGARRGHGRRRAGGRLRACRACSFCGIIASAAVPDSKMRVPTNPAISTALPFNAAVEVLADGILASHKAHYSLNYSAKMGVTDATVRILVLAALRKQLTKPDAADLDACQEYRRAMNTSLMAVCGKMNFPAHLMATYMLGIRDFYVSHQFVDANQVRLLTAEKLQ
jgi:hypothetical protein